MDSKPGSISVLEAAHAVSVTLLRAAVPVHSIVARYQNALQCGIRADLRSCPEEGVAAEIVERAAGIAVASGKRGKSVIVSTVP